MRRTTIAAVLLALLLFGCGEPPGDRGPGYKAWRILYQWDDWTAVVQAKDTGDCFMASKSSPGHWIYAPMDRDMCAKYVEKAR